MKRSLDLREQTLGALSGGMSRSQVCQTFGIHRTTLHCWQVRQDATVDEHLRLWREEQEVSVSRATLARAILRVNWTRKKSA